MKKFIYVCCITLVMISCTLGYWVYILSKELQAKKQEPNLEERIDNALKNMRVQSIEKVVPVRIVPPIIGDWYDEPPRLSRLLVEKLTYLKEDVGSSREDAAWVYRYNKLIDSYNETVDLYNNVCTENNSVIQQNNKLSAANARLNNSLFKQTQELNLATDSLLLSSTALELIKDNYGITYQHKTKKSEYTRIISIEASKLDSALTVLNCYLD